MKTSVSKPDALVSITLRALIETRSVLERLIISSESFDYLAAKQAMILLERKIRRLGKIEAALKSQEPFAANVLTTVKFSSESKPVGQMP